MRLLMIVQELNEASWLRGFIVGWVRALAAEVDELHVLALEQGQAELPANVFVQSMGKERGYTRPQELRAFYAGVGRVIGRVDAVFSHMTPRYVWLAAPLALAHGKPQLLWFIHPRPNAEIRAAAALARWITTATPSSFPLQSRKVHALGHGIDTALFSPAAETEKNAAMPLVLAVGRITPIKNHHLLLEAAAKLPDVQFAIAGQTAAPGDAAYQAQLLRRRDELGIAPERFQLMGGLTVSALVALTRRAALVTNLTPAGSFDKAALEGMLTATPLLTSNPAFDDLLGDYGELLHLPDPAALPAKIREVLALPMAERARMGLYLRERTAQAHGLTNLMRRIVGLIGAG